MNSRRDSFKNQRAVVPPAPVSQPPLARAPSARANRNRASKAEDLQNANPDEKIQSLNVRVKEREPERPKSRLSSLFSKGDSSSTPAGIRPISEVKSDLKETLSRPLTSLFRRSQSNASASNAPPTRSSTRDVAKEFSTETVGAAELDHTPGAEHTHFQADLSDQAAIAPHIHMHRVSSLYPNEPTYLHIKNINLGKFNDLDVSFLARFICPEDEVTDETIPWNWDYLYASVSSELREEWLLEKRPMKSDPYIFVRKKLDFTQPKPNGQHWLLRENANRNIGEEHASNST
uniref:Uncharacterized protein n=1 Tax=Ditylenchus dipsaci TaxID=166011 RepID=A0A915DGE7_9BILA